MSLRTERKQRADKKREEYASKILSKIKQVCVDDPHLPLKEVFFAGDLYISHLLKQNPHDAHLIRSAAYRIKGELEEILRKHQK